LQRDLAGLELFGVQTRARSKAEYLMRPDLGRRLDDESREKVRANCPAGADFQILIGDGLSAMAVAVQASPVLEQLRAEAKRRGWKVGVPFFVKYCRVGVLNDVGDLLAAEVNVLLIGERPGLATAESLSAYLAYRPRAGHTDADRNLISNIHANGVIPYAAAQRIIALAERMRTLGRSGTGVMEELTMVPIPLALGTTSVDGEGG
jgi:ethanolamine ammonia-lyase small subunit